jgi:hypothetical protein
MKYNFRIPAIRYISLSEIQKVLPDFDYKDEDKLRNILYELGVDLQYPFDEQDVFHINKFNEKVNCLRWVGNERTDQDWLKSGYASKEATDKSLGNKLLNDLYRLKGYNE